MIDRMKQLIIGHRCKAVATILSLMWMSAIATLWSVSRAHGATIELNLDGASSPTMTGIYGCVSAASLLANVVPRNTWWGRIVHTIALNLRMSAGGGGKYVGPR